jgi:glycosyltransferase involved in cell wall biosynthesis
MYSLDEGAFGMIISTPKLSVIIPVYNTGEFLDACIESVFNQSMKEIEIIIVDDGSDDGSEKKCDYYALADNRVIVIHQANKGLSEARNIGIRHTGTDYLMFVDSDDVVDRSFCQTAYDSAVDSKADIVVFGYDRIDISGYVISDGYRDNKDIEGVYSKKDALCLLAAKKIEDYAWNKIYRRTMFNEVKFPSGERWEDMAISYLLFDRADRVKVINTILYHYRYRPGSLIREPPETRLEIVAQRRNDAYEYLRRHCEEAGDIMRVTAAVSEMNYCEYFRHERKGHFDDVRSRLLAKQITIEDIGVKFWLKTKVLQISPVLFANMLDIRKKISGI